MPKIKDSDAIKVTYKPQPPPPPNGPPGPPKPKKKVPGLPPEINVAEPPEGGPGKPSWEWEKFPEPLQPKPPKPKDGEGPPKEGEGPPKEGEGPPKEGEGPPKEGEGPPKEGEGTDNGEIGPPKEDGEKEGDRKKGAGEAPKEGDLDHISRDTRPYATDTEYLDKLSDNTGEQAYEKIISAARQIESSQGAGRGTGGSEVAKLTDIHDKYKKAQVNWKAELRSRIRKFTDLQIAEATQEEESWFAMNYNYVTQTSGGAFIAPGTMQVEYLRGIVLIYSIDVSGSIGQKMMTDMLAELNDIARVMKSKAASNQLAGKVYATQWDTESVTGLEEFTPNMKFHVRQKTGGTDPTVAFKAVDETITKKSKAVKGSSSPFVLELPKLGVPLIVPRTPQVSFSNAPLMVIVTDGEFFREINRQDLGAVYGASPKNILWLLTSRSTVKNVYPQNKDQIIFI